jgi:cellulose synthase/poly-beta-1,6-N-acetylglucosamine synthase-like glycosyltransferase
MTGRWTAAGSLLALAGAIHSLSNARRLRRPEPGAASPEPVSVLVPARDEAARIESCLRSLIGPAGVREIIVLDDQSTDGTGAQARALGAQVITGTPPPPGWLGKPWACAQLATAADPASAVLVFVDADVRLRPDAVRAATALLEAAGLDLACPFPRQLAVTPAERLVQPLLQWSWLTTLPLRLAERSPRPSLTAACGQFVVVRRSALDRVGGFAAVRGDVLDDLALARAIKAGGGRAGVVDGTNLAATRMYEGWAELRDGYGRSLWTAFGSPAGAIGVVALLAITYVLPPLAALRGSRLGALGYLAGVASRVVAARATGGRAWPDAFAHPASVGVFGYLTLRSLREHRRGALRWKGRPIDVTPVRPA